MSTRIVDVVVDAADPSAQAQFWAELLGWRISHQSAEEVDLQAPPDDGWEFDLIFVPVPEPKTRKNRLHLEVSSASPDQQMSTLERALSLGAKRVDIGQRNVPWFVLADPEGNEFCVLDPRPEYATTGAIAAIVIDTVDHAKLGEFWAAATGWPILEQPDYATSLRSPTNRGPWLELINTGEPHEIKNRIHLDLAPTLDGDQDAEVSRLVSLGAHAVDIGQGGDASWKVLADPEGNEFCVMRPR